MNPKTEEALRLAREALQNTYADDDCGSYCAFCHMYATHEPPHYPNCIGQRALAAIDALDASDTPPSQSLAASDTERSR